MKDIVEKKNTSPQDTPQASTTNRFQYIPKKRDPNLGQLIELGTRGLFPLFYVEWISESFQKPETHKRKLTRIERDRLNKIFYRLSKHKSFDRKQTVLMTLDQADRKLFIHAFMYLVESKILDSKPDLH